MKWRDKADEIGLHVVVLTSWSNHQVQTDCNSSDVPGSHHYFTKI